MIKVCVDVYNLSTQDISPAYGAERFSDCVSLRVHSSLSSRVWFVYAFNVPWWLSAEALDKWAASRKDKKVNSL